jgi:hypothetical protein
VIDHAACQDMDSTVDVSKPHTSSSRTTTPASASASVLSYHKRIDHPHHPNLSSTVNNNPFLRVTDRIQPQHPPPKDIIQPGQLQQQQQLPHPTVSNYSTFGVNNRPSTGSAPQNPPNAPSTLPPPPFRKGEVVDQGRIKILSFVGQGMRILSLLFARISQCFIICQQGSFAHVYKAYDTVSQSHCAVKCLLKSGLDPVRLAAQKREVHAMQDLSGHPNIVKLIRVVDTGDWLLIVMEFCEIDLYDTIMQKGGLPDHAVKDVFSQLCDAVSHCHGRGYFHRDIKPENCLIDVSTFTVKLTDFGLATRDTWSYEMGCGSSRYISPEGCLSANHKTGYSPAASDIWALGIILINLLFSKNPVRSCLNFPRALGILMWYFLLPLSSSGLKQHPPIPYSVNLLGLDPIFFDSISACHSN